MTYPDNITHRAVSTPWGPSQDAEVIADGITFHSTASHGGIHLSPTRQAQMPAYFRDTFAGGPWYEEDCDYVRVALVFPQFFPTLNRDNALRNLRFCHPAKADRFERESNSAA